MRRKTRVFLLLPICVALGWPVHATPPPSKNGQRTAVAVSDPILFDVAPYVGIEYGMAKELVYQSTASLTDYKLSELDWPLEPSYFTGVNLSFRAVSGLLASFQFRTALPSVVGVIEDSDFLNYDGRRTHYSQHTAHLERSISAQADIGWRLPSEGPLTLTPFFRYLYRDIKWSADNGYYQYPPQSAPPYTYWSPGESKTYLYGPIALYEQIFSIPAFGVTGDFAFSSTVSLGASLTFSPLASISDIDHHLLKKLIFYDDMTFCTYFAPSLSLSVRPSKHVAINVVIEYLNVISPPDGTIRTEDTTTGVITTSAGTGGSAGASLRTFNASLGVDIRP